MLLDTSGLLCLLHRGESFHQEACRIYRTAGVKLTHGYVLAEFVALAQSRRLPRMEVLEFVFDLVANPDIETVWVDEVLHQEAMALLKARPDKTYSLCDAISFVLMRREGVQEALTTDRHFVQEGFHKMLG